MSPKLATLLEIPPSAKHYNDGLVLVQVDQIGGDRNYVLHATSGEWDCPNPDARALHKLADWITANL